jgi:hypothetical protein
MPTLYAPYPDPVVDDERRMRKSWVGFFQGWIAGWDALLTNVASLEAAVEALEPSDKAWGTAATSTIYQAAARVDVCVLCNGGVGGGGEFYVLTDSNPTPSTIRVEASIVNSGFSSLTCPVKGGDYYRVITNVTGGSPAFTVQVLG